MYRFFIFCIFLMFPIACLPADFHRKINWKQNEPQKIDDLNFDGSVMLDHSRLPYWIESMKTDDFSPVVELKDTVFEALPDSIGSSLKNVDNKELKFSVEMATSDRKPVLRLTVFPFIRKGGQVKRLTGFSFTVRSNENKLKTKSYSWKTSSVLSSGNWVKVKTTGKGMYKITYDQLKQWGFSSPDNVSVYGNGGLMLPVLNKNTSFDDLSQYPVLKGTDSSGKTCLFFYSTGNIGLTENSTTGILSHQQNYYSTATYFYLTDGGTLKTIDKASDISSDADRQVTTFNNYTYYEKEAVNLLSSGSRWFGETFANGGSQTFALTLDNPDLTQSVQVTVSAVARSSSSSYLNVNVNGSSVSNINFSALDVTEPTADYADDQTTTFSDHVSSGDMQVKLTYGASNSTSEAWLDYISVNYTSSLNMSSDVYLFRGKGAVGSATVSQFVLSNASSVTKIIDVTDINNAFEVPTTLSGTQLTFKSNYSGTREYVAFNTTGSIPSAEFVENVDNQNLHAESVPDMIIVTAPKLKTAAEKLASFHSTNDGLNVKVVTPDVVYNEFSGGLPDPSGLRNYFKMCYKKGSNLKYVLLLGDGSYDNRNILGNNFNLIPTYQSENSLSPVKSFVTDDFFAFLDENEGGSQGIVDLGIGRIPANTLTDAETVVAKIKNYCSTSSLGNWRNMVTFIADDGDDNTHMEQAESMASSVNTNYPAFYTDKIYLDAYTKVSSSSGSTYPEVNEAILNRFKQGTLVMNYTGHSNEKVLAAEDVLDISAIQSLSNYNKLPVFVTASCEFSRFDEDITTAGEYLLFNSTGGSIGLFSTTRLVNSGDNFVLNTAFFNSIFEKDQSGENLRLGDVMKAAKTAANTGTNQLNFTLLADPALRLANPGYQVITTEINNIGTESGTDITISSLSKVTVKGYIADLNGAKATSFSGEIIPVVYDKAMDVETLGNDGETAFTYSVQNNVLYKGTATVDKGEFEFEFVVPKDVSAKIGKGKILYYANNGTIDAKGYFNNFLVGGTTTKTETDTSGPVINLYMNSESFTDGGEVGPSANLIAKISDETGINASGIGIGHDITAVLDGDETNIMVLNDYFQTDKDSYTSGTVTYPLTGLTEGEHTLVVKAWDLLNNSSQAEIHFVVNNALKIESVTCYPNPMKESTNFVFTSNYPDESFDVVVDVYQVSGAKVDSYETTVVSSGDESAAIEWIPSDRQVNMKAGIYIYRLTVTASNGKISKASGKLLCR